jgi:hypothetical protein
MEEKMSIKTLMSSVTLATTATLVLGASALAQTMVGDIEVTEADMPAVTEHCETLADTDATDEMVSTDAAADDFANTEAMPEDDAATDMTTTDNAATDAPDSGETTDAGAENVDHTLMTDAITLEDCQSAGIIE